MRKITISLMFVSLFAMSVFAEGYKLNLQGQKQAGMGHIGTGLCTDASGIFFNPGSISLLDKKMSIVFGGNAIMSHNIFQYQAPSIYKAESDNPMGTPFYFYGMGKITEKLVAGVGVYTPFGNSLNWGDDWKGRYLVQNIKMQVFYIQPTVSYKINDKIGIGAGLIYANGSVHLEKAIPVSNADGDGKATIEGKSSGWGFNVGLMVKPIEKMQIGISYQSKIDLELEGGDATFKVPASLATNFPEANKFSASLPLVSSLNFGITYHVSEKLFVGIDVNYLGWAAYDSLNFDFETNTSSLTDSKNERDYKNTLTYRLGAQYKASEKLEVRIGAYFDETPTNDKLYSPETPGANKIGLSCGLTYNISEKFSVDASYLYIRAMEREANYEPESFGGTYNSWAFIPGIGLNYHF